MEKCSCGSGKLYQACCELYHEGAASPTALALMRSRYSAYARGLADYIVKTTHPDHPDCKRDLEVRRQEILQFCQATLFKHLEILEDKEGEKRSTVTFKVILSQQGKDFSFTEKSLFEKVDGRWLYLSGELTS